MNCKKKIGRRPALILLVLATAHGCGKSKGVSVPPPVVVSQTADNVEKEAPDSLAAESPTAGEVAAEEVAATDAGDPAGDANTEPNPAVRDASDADPDDSTVEQVPEPTATDDETAIADDAVATTDAGESTDDVSTVVADALPTERFALLTPGGPLIVAAIITIDGDVHSSALEALVEDAYEAADTDGDGKRTWNEVTNSPKFMYGQFGNLPFTNDAEKRQLITRYDRNEDGVVDRNELPRFVTRNAGRSRSFSLRSSNEFRSDNRSRSPFRLLLDADHDGAITPEEMAAAPARLLSHDGDDDQIITLADFKDNATEMPGQMSTRRRTSEPDTAFVINEDTKWAYASFALRELYSFGDDIGISDWPATPELFATLDVDKDERLQRKEIEQLATVEPHIRLRLGFGVKDQEDGPRKTSLALDYIDPQLAASVNAVRIHDRRVSIELSRVEVEFFVNEDPSLLNYEEVAKAQFNTFDTDSNGYLDEEEIPAQLPGLNVPFAGVDADSDGKVYLAELASFLEMRQRAYKGQVRARAADQEDALFTALDTSGDGRLHTREIAATPAMLKKMDLNQDGDLQSHEIPGSMVVGFVRGNPQQDNSLLIMPTGTGEAATAKLPRWFSAMDTNGDGEVGAREFLGTVDRFAKFDNDSDGFINPTELPSEMAVKPETQPESIPEPEVSSETGS